MIEIEDRLSRIIANELAVDCSKITPTACFIGDLGTDSFGVLEVVVSVEDAFDIDISNEAVLKIRTVGDLIALIKSRRH